MEQALLRYASDLAESPTLADVAAVVNVSPAHLRRLFQAVRGESPKEAFNRIRMQKVEELLVHSDLTVERIAEDAGFSSASSLTYAVCRHFGNPPGRLRRKRRREMSEGGV